MSKHSHRRIVHLVLILALCAGLIAVSHIAGSIIAVAVLAAYGLTEVVLHFVHDAERHHAENKAEKTRPAL